MAWQPTKPASGDLVFGTNNTRKDIQENFSAIDTAWDINHIGIGDSGQGKHNYVSLPEQGSAPTTAAAELALFTQDPTVTTDGAELYFRRESNGTVYPMTESNKIAGADTPLSVGWTMLPSGILIKWGTIDTAGGDAGITFPTGTTDKAFTAAYRAFLTPVDSASGDSDDAIRLKSFTTTQLLYYGSPRTTTGAKAMTFNFLCIGLGV